MDIDDEEMDGMLADLAALKAQSEAMQADITEIKRDLKETLRVHGDRLVALEVGQATFKQAWKGHRDQHITENRTVTAVSTIVSSIVAGVMSIIGWFRKP